MSRSGYTEECDDYLEIGRWRGRVKSATNGKRGQEFFHKLIVALDAMEVKELAAMDSWEDEGLYKDGKPCVLGALADHMVLDRRHEIDASEHGIIGELLNIAPCLVAEIEYENDEGCWGDITDARRWELMRKWAVKQLKVEA
jgi:hypothetical protein